MTLAELITLSRQLSDTENSQFVSNAEITGYINFFYKDLYDEMIVTNEDFHLQTLTFTITTGNTYLLPLLFYKARLLEKVHGGLNYERIDYLNLEEKNISNGLRYRIVGNEIALFPENHPEITGDYRLYYYPKLAPLVNSADETVNLEGMDWLIAIRTANTILAKQEIVNPGLVKIETEMMQRLKRMASYRSSDAQVIARVR